MWSLIIRNCFYPFIPSGLQEKSWDSTILLVVSQLIVSTHMSESCSGHIYAVLKWIDRSWVLNSYFNNIYVYGESHKCSHVTDEMLFFQ